MGLETFSSAYINLEIVNHENIDIPLISFEDLIVSKKALNREKDHDDIDQLNKKRDF